MKHLLLVPKILFAIIVIVFLEGCSDSCDTSYNMVYYEPVYTTLEELRTSVEVVAAREITKSGKIYLINGYLLINEPNEGIHIIDNSNPSNPVSKSFLKIPGNFDMAAVDGYLYADSYMDLVVFDISNVEEPLEIKRVEDLFPSYNSYGFYANAERGVVTDWVEVEHVQELNFDCDEMQANPWGMYHREGIAMQSDAAFNASMAVSPANPGMGGSMARFTIAKQHLYMIDNSNLHVVDISDPASPMLGSQVNVGFGIETIFPYDSLIFIGANNGMSIYDVSEPLRPTRLSEYSHVNSCDPVVTDGRYAYVTLRSGNQCAGFTNQLEIIDIADPSSPQLITTYPMYNPHGLSISDNRLFICDGEAGLKIYDATDVSTIDQHMIKHYGDIHAYDVIVADCHIMLIGEDGLSQYHCNDFEDIQYLSNIPFKK